MMPCCWDHSCKCTHILNFLPHLFYLSSQNWFVCFPICVDSEVEIFVWIFSLNAGRQLLSVRPNHSSMWGRLSWCGPGGSPFLICRASMWYSSWVFFHLFWIWTLFWQVWLALKFAGNYVSFLWSGLFRSASLMSISSYTSCVGKLCQAQWTMPWFAWKNEDSSIIWHLSSALKLYLVYGLSIHILSIMDRIYFCNPLAGSSIY